MNNAMSLRGLTVAITGSRRASELAQIVENFGGKPYIAPTVGIEANLSEPNKSITEFINRIVKQDADYVVFMTGPGVFSLMTLARSRRNGGGVTHILKESYRHRKKYKTPDGPEKFRH